jgi:molybdopterin converting factor subunit 1
MKVLFFARLRELNGGDGCEIDDADCPATVAELRALLRGRLAADIAAQLGDPNVFCAVNQRVADEDQAITPADEIAFFPPMTGG